MKKIISLLLSVLMVFGVLSVTAFAAEKTYTEKFISDVKSGFTVKANISGLGSINVAVKDDKAAFNASIAGFDAKVIMEGSKLTAYVGSIFKINASDILGDYLGNIKVSDITDAIDMIPEDDLADLLKYTTVTDKVEGTKVTETFTANLTNIAEDLKAAMIVAYPDLAPVIQGFDATQFIAWCDELEVGDEGFEEYNNVAKKVGGTLYFEDNGKTLTSFEVVLPNEDFKGTKSITMADVNKKLDKITVSSISTNVDDSAFSGSGIFDITWLVKLLINFFASKVSV